MKYPTGTCGGAYGDRGRTERRGSDCDMTMDSESKPDEAQLNDLRYDAEPSRGLRGDTLLPLRLAAGSVV